MPLRRLLCALVGVLLAACLAAPAAASPYLPPPGRVWNGVTAGESIGDWQARTGRHPAVWQHFVQWNGWFEHAFERARQSKTRLMLHLSTSDAQDNPGRFSPGEIARGFGDEWLVQLADRLATAGRPSYLRLMGEMNNCRNAYAAYDCSGRRRDADHSAARFKQAWRRVHVILRGGDGAAIDARLQRLGMPGLKADGAVFPRAPVALMWAPMTGGSPNIAGLSPGVYWPGRRWVDWVGTSFYSRFPNFRGLEPFYRTYAVRMGKPFALAEWAMWGADDAGFVHRLFGWVRTHERVRMVQYNQGSYPGSIFRLDRYPAAARALRQALRSERFVASAPEFG